LGNWFSPFSRRQVLAAAMTSLKTISRAVSCDNAPLVRTVRCRTVANTLSMALLQTLRRSGGMRTGREGRAVSDFKGRHFEGEIVLWVVRWYCGEGNLSLREPVRGAILASKPPGIWRMSVYGGFLRTFF
jgi:hypothetical protein